MGGYDRKNCEFCTYSWISRVKIPKSCPRCKRRFDYIEAKLVLKTLGKKYGYNLLNQSAELLEVQNGKS